MTKRSGSAASSAPPPTPTAPPNGANGDPSPSLSIPHSLAAAGSSSRASSGGNSSLKNFGPPTLQSDTVVFQAARIPLSSARLSSTPGSAVAPSAVVASGRGPPSANRGRDVDGRYGGGVAPPQARGPPPGQYRPTHEREASPLRRQPTHSMRHLHHGDAGHDYPSPGMVPQQRRPRSPMSRDRGAGNPRDYDEEMGGGNGSIQPLMRGPHSDERGRTMYDGRGGGGGGEFTHMLMEDHVSAGASRSAGGRPRSAEGAAASAALLAMNQQKKARQQQQRQQRPTSADSKAANASRRVVRLTIRVMKDGDKLGFGIRNDSNRKLKVSTLQTNSTAAKSALKIGDTILTVNGVDLTDMGFLEVIQQLKATKPGELVFDIERSLDEDESLSGAESGSQQGETMDLDSPLSVAEKRFGPAAIRAAMVQPAPNHIVDPTELPIVNRRAPAQRSEAPNQFGDPTESPFVNRRGTPMTSSPGMNQQHAMAQPPYREIIAGVPYARDSMPSNNLPPSASAYPAENSVEPLRKRPRPPGTTPGQLEMEMMRMDKQHRAVLSALTLELKKERTEKMSLEEKNSALRKRLQNMLIECDEVRVKASSTVASIKEHSQRDIHELKQALQAARAQLRLQDRGPDVARTDSIVNELVSTKEQLNRLRKLEMERATNMSNRYSLESRQAEREAHRTRERLISMFEAQLRDVARRHYNNNGIKTSGKDTGNANLVVQCEGLRRLAFVKMFGLPCSYEWYTSDDFYSTTLVRHALQKQEDLMEIFGNTLCHEERAGLFLVANAPMNVAYDPTIEKLTLSCSWTEQNQVRELARNFRF